MWRCLPLTKYFIFWEFFYFKNMKNLKNKLFQFVKLKWKLKWNFHFIENLEKNSICAAIASQHIFGRCSIEVRLFYQSSTVEETKIYKRLLDVSQINFIHLSRSFLSLIFYKCFI